MANTNLWNNMMELTIPKLPFGEVTIMNGALYFRHDFYLTQDDLDEGLSPSDEYYDCVEMLKDEGYEFNDPYVEHDCITGDIIQINGD